MTMLRRRGPKGWRQDLSSRHFNGQPPLKTQCIKELQLFTRITAYLLSGQIGYFPDQKGGTSAVPVERRGIECCASGYPELKSLQ